jgi:hypothetical protein
MVLLGMGQSAWRVALNNRNSVLVVTFLRYAPCAMRFAICP